MVKHFIGKGEFQQPVFGFFKQHASTAAVLHAGRVYHTNHQPLGTGKNLPFSALYLFPRVKSMGFPGHSSAFHTLNASAIYMHGFR
jgi:hypothetical protein